MYRELKKNARADLNRVRPLIFSISLTITMLLTITAFEWKTYDRPGERRERWYSTNFEEVLDVPPTEIKPPPPVIMRNPSIMEVPDAEKIKEEIKVALDVEMTGDMAVSRIAVIEPKVEVEEEKTDEIFSVVEQPAEPRDGMANFYRYVKETIHYPAQAQRMGIDGRVYVEFVVDKDGSLTQVNVIKGVGFGCDEEALRIIKGSPPWTPGKQRGRPVRQRMVLPIIFVLDRR